MTKNDQTVAFAVGSSTPRIRFLASLSDGRTVIQDDRPKTRHAWGRLGEWLKANPEICITELRLQGQPGSNIEIKMPSNQLGYFLGFKHQVVWPGASQHTYLGVGYYDGSNVHIVWHRQPRLDHSYTETRSASAAGFFLIKNG